MFWVKSLSLVANVWSINVCVKESGIGIGLQYFCCKVSGIGIGLKKFGNGPFLLLTLCSFHR